LSCERRPDSLAEQTGSVCTANQSGPETVASEGLYRYKSKALQITNPIPIFFIVSAIIMVGLFTFIEYQRKEECRSKNTIEIDISFRVRVDIVSQNVAIRIRIAGIDFAEVPDTISISLLQGSVSSTLHRNDITAEWKRPK